MTQIWLPDYWDLAKSPSDKWRIDWCGPDGPADVWAYDVMSWSPEYGGCTRLDNCYGSPIAWGAAWFLKVDPVRGLLEVADWETKKTWADKTFIMTPEKRVRYTKRNPIPWGGHVDVGQTDTWTVNVDPWPHGGVIAYLPPFPVPNSGCRQIVTYRAHYDQWTDPMGRIHKDVLEIEMRQPWGTNATCDGGVTWLAKSVGRVAAQWNTYETKSLKLLTQSDVASGIRSEIVSPAAATD